MKIFRLSNNFPGVLFPYWAAGRLLSTVHLFGVAEEMFEAACLDGAGHPDLYWRITLPLGSISA
jgi:ABC-type glycerol-3-phosphate transport system permease component